MLVDFHCHTNCSDGELSPQQLIDLAQQNSIKIISITDHDNIDAYSQIDTKLLGDMRLIPGIEFSTTWNKIGIHIVGLNFNLDSKYINRAIQKHKIFRIKRAEIISKKLERIGLINAYEKLSKNGLNQIGRPDFAQLLVKEGLCKNVQQAFKKYLGAGKMGDVKNQWLSYQEIIHTIQDSGGTAVLAHPLLYKLTNSKLKRLIKDFAQSGGEAIEVINGYQNPNKTAYLQKLSNEFNLKASIGSDFHRHNKWSKLGCDTQLISHNISVWDETMKNV
ncbi:MAG: PHP domain-containing protein [Marinicellaceae bacterium]